MPLKLGILAGEASGDNLAAGLMAQLRRQAPDGEDIEFIGVGGPRMLALGLRSLASMERLSVNGFREPLMRLPELLGLLRRLSREIAAADVDGFIGVDFNVFNFLLEASLKKRGVRTVHYVSPSVYAWRAGRTRRVAKSADMLLCLYPFEPAFYIDTSVEAVFVGHPLADAIGPEAGDETARQAAREALGLRGEGTVLAVLPGSRSSEIGLMIESFVSAAKRFLVRNPETQIVVPCLRPVLRDKVDQALRAYPELPVTLYDGDARQALVACDIALVKSGTSTLEAMLLSRPMVVSYRLGRLSAHFARWVLRTPYVALPNILSGRRLVPELLQDEATGVALAEALQEQLQHSLGEADYFEPFHALQRELRQSADEKAAAAVLRLLAS